MKRKPENGQTGVKVTPIEVTPEMIEAGTEFVMNFFPAEWGRRGPIERSEAKAVACGVLRAAAGRCGLPLGTR